MSNTDSHAPYRVRVARGDYDPNKFDSDSGFRKGRRALKRQGNKHARRNWKQPRYSKRPFCDDKTVRTAIFYY